MEKLTELLIQALAIPATILIIIKLTISYNFAYKIFRLVIIFHLIMEMLWKNECFFIFLWLTKAIRPEQTIQNSYRKAFYDVYVLLGIEIDAMVLK